MPATSVETESAAQLRAVIGRLSRWLRPTAAATAAGLTPTGVAVLLRVVRHGPVRLADLSAAEGINPTMLSRVISDLVQDGLVQRTSDEGDRRSAWAEATRAGIALAQQMRRERTDAVNQALERLSGADRRRIEQAVTALEHLADELGEVRR